MFCAECKSGPHFATMQCACCEECHRRLALLSVVACRQASIAVVAPSLEEDFAAIVAGYNEAAGYEAFPLDEDGAWAIVDDKAIDAYRAVSPGVEGFLDMIGNTIKLPSKEAFVSRGFPPPWYRMAFAHEIGHVLIGAVHTSTGLMNIAGDLKCVGREGACLYEAVQHFNGVK